MCRKYNENGYSTIENGDDSRTVRQGNYLEKCHLFYSGSSVCSLRSLSCVYISKINHHILW